MLIPCENAELDSFCSPFGVGVGLPGIWQIKTRKALESSNKTQSDVYMRLIFDVTGLRGVVTGLETSKHSPGTTVCVVDSLTDGLEVACAALVQIDAVLDLEQVYAHVWYVGGDLAFCFLFIENAADNDAHHRTCLSSSRVHADGRTPS